MRNPMRNVQAQRQTFGFQIDFCSRRVRIKKEVQRKFRHTQEQGQQLIPSGAGSAAVGHGLPGLADGDNGELETAALRAQGYAGRPRS